MKENEYKDNEKVLYRTRGKLSLPHNIVFVVFGILGLLGTAYTIVITIVG